MVLVASLARRDLLHPRVQGGHHEAGARLLLTGVILAAGWGALITLILAIAPESRLRGMLFWLTGDLGGTASYGAALATLAVALALAMPMARSLNVMLLGETVAQSLGVQVGRVRLATFLIASFAIAAAITTAGSIGFVGLVVPHMVRLAWGNDQRLLLPASVLPRRHAADGGGSDRPYRNRPHATAGGRDYRAARRADLPISAAAEAGG